jgi:hypothetical protein
MEQVAANAGAAATGPLAVLLILAPLADIVSSWLLAEGKYGVRGPMVMTVIFPSLVLHTMLTDFEAFPASCIFPVLPAAGLALLCLVLYTALVQRSAETAPAGAAPGAGPATATPAQGDSPGPAPPPAAPPPVEPSRRRLDLLPGLRLLCLLGFSFSATYWYDVQSAMHSYMLVEVSLADSATGDGMATFKCDGQSCLADGKQFPAAKPQRLVLPLAVRSITVSAAAPDGTAQAWQAQLPARLDSRYGMPAKIVLQSTP